MADTSSPLGLWGRMLAAPNDSRGKTLFMAVTVSAVAALAVSAAAVLLGPQAAANRAAEQQARLEAMMASLPGLADLIQSIGAEAIETLIVDLTTDDLAEGIDPAAFDGTSPTATPLPPEQDIAGLGERPDIQRLYVLRSDGALQLVILPFSGAGYASTIEGYLAVEGDLETVAGLTITEQGETPGLGANIATPAWQAKWPGTSLVNADGEIAIDVVQAGASQPWQVDGITGATRTGAGMENMIRFWMGPQGFGPVLEKIQAGAL